MSFSNDELKQRIDRDSIGKFGKFRKFGILRFFSEKFIFFDKKLYICCQQSFSSPMANVKLFIQVTR